MAKASVHAKQPTQAPITANDIASVYSLSDFAFEMSIRSLLEHYGDVEHGETYVDPVEGKPRQFDLRLHIRKEQYGQILALAVECKRIREDCPLVVCGTARTVRESFHDYVQSDGTVGCRPTVMRTSPQSRFYPASGFVGKSILPLKPDEKAPGWIPGRDESREIYNRWSQALASAVDLCRAARFAGSGRGRVFRTTILPILAVPNNTLWAASFDTNHPDRPVITAVPEATVFLNHGVTLDEGYHYMCLSHLHVYTTDGLTDFLDHYARAQQVHWEHCLMPTDARHFNKATDWR